MKKIVILGAGPAGLSLGLKLLRRSDLNIEIVIIERKSYTGGMTSSFQVDGLSFDYGSHRLHGMAAPKIIKEFRELLGPDLLDRPRKGRIRLLGEFVRFPLNPADMALRMPPAFLIGIVRDAIFKPFSLKNNQYASFADVLRQKVGKTVCENFYFPYARKLWGLPPEKIGAIQAFRRVSADSIGKMARKAFWFIPGSRQIRAGRFFYPRKGFGQICQAMAHEIHQFGGKIVNRSTIQRIELKNNKQVNLFTVQNESSSNDTNSHTESVSDNFKADMIFSTIPLKNLIGYLYPEPPEYVIEASAHLRYRGILLCYLILATDRFTAYDTHYFPQEDVIFSRISEPKNFRGDLKPGGTTGLCAEIPCWVGDDIWNASEDDIYRKVIDDLGYSGLPVKYPVKTACIRRLPHAYPVYELDFEQQFQVIDHYLNDIPNIIPFGRHGLFIHDNMHHALEMANAASRCLKKNGAWDQERWMACRERFQTMIVED